MRRAFVDDDRLTNATIGATVLLPPAVGHRFGCVLRLVDGDAIEVFDREGRVARGTFLPPSSMRVEHAGLDDVRLPPLWVFQAVSRAEKTETVAQKATELGASNLVFFFAERGIVKLDDEDRARKRTARLQRIADDAARQCGRSKPPAVQGPLSRSALLTCVADRVHEGVVVVYGAVDGEQLLSAHLQRHPPARGFGVIVGPEGGLSPDEQQALAEAGAVPVRFSRFVLRTETAATAALAIAQTALREA